MTNSRFKFRAWHRGYQDRFNNIPPAMLCEGYPGQCFKWLAEGQPIEIMAFTGLTDKNGKDIFEGDKCKITTSLGYCVNAFVVMIDGCFELQFVSPIRIKDRYGDRDYLKCYTVNHAVEIFGNIYQDSHLLEDPQ